MATPASRRRPVVDAGAAADATRVLLALALLYGTMSLLAYRVIHMRHVFPLGPDAPPGEFSEGRVLQHIHRLAVDIPGRQEGRPGLEAAAQYIKGQLQGLAAHAGPEYRIEVEETQVSGSFSMMFLRHRVTLGYRNHKNIVMRISSNVSEEDEPSLLVNGHFDSPLGSSGAADCGSCVASMLELSRLILESGWVPPRPVIFLFNGAEELFLLGSHGFIKTHKWSNTIGAFINIEASGSGGADLVCQSGPGSWPSRVYAQTAKYPMANSVAQRLPPPETPISGIVAPPAAAPEAAGRRLPPLFHRPGHRRPSSSALPPPHAPLPRLPPRAPPPPRPPLPLGPPAAPATPWRSYTLQDAGAFAAAAGNGTIILAAVSGPYLPFLSNWLISVRRAGRADQVLVIAEDYETLERINAAWPGHAVLVPPAPDAQAAHKFGSQDMFGIIPGDTDYRIFAEDVANIPGLDIIFVLGGYFYHTSYDTLENLLPGSIQARGENLFNLVKAFTNSSMLLNESERYNKAVHDGIDNLRATFFDYMTWFMIFYPRDVSLILHSLPGAVFLLTPLFLNFPNITMMSMFRTVLDLARGMLLHAFGVILAIVIPAMAAGLRLLFTKNAMNWFAHPYLAFLMFVPASLVGLLLPRFIWGLSEQSHFWGAFGLYSLVTMAYMLAGLSGGFLTFFISMSLLLGRFISSISRKQLSRQSPRSLFGYVIPMIPCLLYCVYYGGFLIQFLIEKMGMMGSLPKPFGYFVPDIIVAAMVGLVVGWCFGPLIPIASRWLAKTSILQGFLQITVVAMAISSQLFPYSTGAPKRIVLQHTFVTDSNNIVESNYGFSVVDANSLEFVFNNAPEAAKWLKDNSELSLKEKYWSDRSSWVALYPVPFLFSGSLKFPAQTQEIRKHYQHFPRLVVQKTLSNSWNRRVHLELSLGSLSEIWTTSLNITGPLSNWSFADNTLPAPQTVSGGPPSYICRLTGQSNENWSFWLEANSSEPLRIDVAVLDQCLVDSTKELKSLFPSWADMTVFTTFFSTYHL